MTAKLPRHLNILDRLLVFTENSSHNSTRSGFQTWEYYDGHSFEFCYKAIATHDYSRVWLINFKHTKNQGENVFDGLRIFDYPPDSTEPKAMLAVDKIRPQILNGQDVPKTFKITQVRYKGYAADAKECLMTGRELREYLGQPQIGMKVVLQEALQAAESRADEKLLKRALGLLANGVGRKQ